MYSTQMFPMKIMMPGASESIALTLEKQLPMVLQAIIQHGAGVPPDASFLLMFYMAHLLSNRTVGWGVNVQSDKNGKDSSQTTECIGKVT